MLTALVAIACVAAYLFVGAVTAGLMLRIAVACKHCDDTDLWWGCGPHHCAWMGLGLWPLFLASVVAWRLAVLPSAMGVRSIALGIAGHRPRRLRGEALQRRIDQLEREAGLK